VRVRAGLVALGVAGCMTATMGSAKASTPSVAVSAHRGGAGQWPQNSLFAFTRALAAGYDEIEADAWVTLDGYKVIYHDATINADRCPGIYVGRTVESLTLAQLMHVHCDGYRITTMWQLMDLLRHSSNKHTRLRLEAKNAVSATAAKVRASAKSIAAMVVRYGLVGRTIMQDFRWEGIPAFHAASRTIRASALVFTRPTASLVRQALADGAYDMSYRAQYATNSLNSYLRSHHLVPTVWGVDTVPSSIHPLSPSEVTAVESSFCKVARAGASVVITNYPSLDRRVRSGC
jgi:glycerophosphoryl diester phosphodiesterase